MITHVMTDNGIIRDAEGNLVGVYNKDNSTLEMNGNRFINVFDADMAMDIVANCRVTKEVK
jgi:hypothetical protein